MLRPSSRLAAATCLAVAVAISTPALAQARDSSVGVNNRGGAAAVHQATPAKPSAVEPQTAVSFPSASSTVIGSLGFVDDYQVGYFWSAARGDSVEQTFAFDTPQRVRRLILRLDVPSNALSNGAEVDWTASVNGTDVGNFTVPEGQTGPITYRYTFPAMTGGNYDVKIRVTNEVPGGDGSITLAYAGDYTHIARLRRH